MPTLRIHRISREFKMQSSENPHKCRSNKREVCILASTIFALLINLMAIILGVYVMANLRSPADSQIGPSTGLDDHLGPIACISCDHKSGDMLLKTLTKKITDTEILCCAQSSSQMSDLMELMLRRPEVDQSPNEKLGHSNGNIEPGNFSFSKASAHKRLLPMESFDSSKNPVPIFYDHTVPLHLNVSYHDSLTEHVREVTVLSSGYQISQSGTYLVYSNVRFKPDSSMPCSSFRYRVWEHKVIKNTTDHMKHEILKSVHTCCDNCTMDRETSFASGAFILNTGERLSVEISGLGLISYHPASSYFGLMMLGSLE